MEIRVLAFAGVREILGSEVALELPDGSLVSDLQAELEVRFPALVPYRGRMAIAVDGSLGRANQPLTPGSEVALLPPVSGGDSGSPVQLVRGPIDVAAVTLRVSHSSSGAVVTFLGTVRDHHEGRTVTHLTYDAYEAMALDALHRIASELENDHEALRVAITHRLGEVAAGEASVVIAVSSPHRTAAYEASREALERLKRQVPIWKREHFSDGGSRWREEEPLASATRSVPAANP